MWKPVPEVRYATKLPSAISSLVCVGSVVVVDKQQQQYKNTAANLRFFLCTSAGLRW